jgi:hypothetical protein
VAILGRKESKWVVIAEDEPLVRLLVAVAMRCTTMRPMPAPIVNVVTDAPTFGHAEIVVRPSPAANDTRTSAVAIAIKAPEKIAAQLTAE